MSIGSNQKIHLDFTEKVIPNLVDDELSAAILGALSYDLISIMNKQVVGDAHEVGYENTDKSE